MNADAHTTETGRTRFSVVLEPEDHALLLAVRHNLESRLGRSVALAEVIREAVRQLAAFQGINNTKLV